MLGFLATFLIGWLAFFAFVQVPAFLFLDVTWHMFQIVAPLQLIACAVLAFFAAVEDAMKPSNERMLHQMFKR